MKTIYSSTEGYKRVSNEIADEKVKRGNWKFVAKKGWKVNVRDIKVVPSLQKEVLVVQEQQPRPKFKKGTKQTK